MIIPNNKSKIFISISASPGNTGSYFHNTLYQKLKLNNIYIPFKIKKVNFIKKFLLNLEISGCSDSIIAIIKPLV